MRRLRPAGEEEVIAAFLRQELASDRFRRKVLGYLRRQGASERLVAEPDLTNAQENAQRRRLLRLYRGYGPDAGQYLSGFPTEGVRWERAALTPDELRQVKYITWSYWLELSGGSRLPSDAADRIRTGVRPYGVSNERVLKLAKLVAVGVTFPEPILVTAHEQGGLVVLEGHVRLTAYALHPDALPPELEVIVGYSPHVAQWPLY